MPSYYILREVSQLVNRVTYAAVRFLICRRHNAAVFPVHQRHTMVLVPMNTPGVKIVRPMRVFGYDDAPHGAKLVSQGFVTCYRSC